MGCDGAVWVAALIDETPLTRFPISRVDDAKHDPRAYCTPPPCKEAPTPIISSSPKLSLYLPQKPLSQLYPPAYARSWPLPASVKELSSRLLVLREIARIGAPAGIGASRSLCRFRERIQLGRGCCELVGAFGCRVFWRRSSC